MEKNKPILKWAGNKFDTPVASRVRELWEPYCDRLYIDLFTGAGGMLLDLNPRKALCFDLSAELIELHKFIQAEGSLDLRYFPLENDAATYEKQRLLFQKEQINRFQGRPDLSRESFVTLMIWLNQCCFNGLWRVNSKGLFNTPVGKNSKGEFNQPRIPVFPKYSPDWSFLARDYSCAANYDLQDAFVYADPPYYRTHTMYNHQGFEYIDQLALADFLSKLRCPVVASNSYNVRLMGYYRALGFLVETINVRRTISGNEDRPFVREMLAYKNIF